MTEEAEEKSERETTAIPPPAGFPSSRSIVALLALTEPSIVSNIMRFTPQPEKKQRGGAHCVMATLASLCRAVGPYDHDLPRHFGPHNHTFWREMVLNCFDFTAPTVHPPTTRNTPPSSPWTSTASPDTMILWQRLRVWYRPSEYGFLEQIQTNTRAITSWPEGEDPFTLFCDLALLVDKLSGLPQHANPSKTRALRTTSVLPCLLKSGPMDRLELSTATDDGEQDNALPIPSSITCRSRRQRLRQLITKKLQFWTRVHDQGKRIQVYVGLSNQSHRWLGFLACRTKENDAGSRSSQ